VRHVSESSGLFHVETSLIRVYQFDLNTEKSDGFLFSASLVIRLALKLTPCFVLLFTTQIPTSVYTADAQTHFLIRSNVLASRRTDDVVPSEPSVGCCLVFLRIFSCLLFVAAQVARSRPTFFWFSLSESAPGFGLAAERCSVFLLL
jgi:hypothetical protein